MSLHRRHILPYFYRIDGTTGRPLQRGVQIWYIDDEKSAKLFLCFGNRSVLHEHFAFAAPYGLRRNRPELLTTMPELRKAFT